MADGMKVDHEALRKRTHKFEDAAKRLAKAFEDLESVKQAEGNCWGADDPGEKFEKDYTKAVEESEKGRKYLVENLGATKTELDKVADQWESDDEGSADNIKAAGSAL